VFTDDLGKQLAEALLEQIARPDLKAKHMRLPTQLVRRESCAPPIEREIAVDQFVRVNG
jgi:DNA-binding LacI/PurR family transcriptional regulator